MAPSSSSSRWSLKKISGKCTDVSQTGEGYGNEFNVKFEMIYENSKSANDVFQEMPKLDWHERFTMLEHDKKEWWTFESNMYEHNPLSRTLTVWARKYIIAYNTAMGLGSGLDPGSCTLYSSGLISTKVTKLPQAEDDLAKATAVRDYLKAKGGKLEIVITDRPALINRKERPINKERLLLFIDVGVDISGSSKWSGYQHLTVNGETKKGNASAKATRSALEPPSGYTEVVPDPGVAKPRPPVLMSGEYL